MADSTNTIDQISSSQSQKEVVVNANTDAASWALSYGRRASTTAGLTWGYNEAIVDVAGVPTKIAAGTHTLTASTTNYIYRTSAGVSTQTTTMPTGWPGPISSPAGAVALYAIVTGASSVTSYTDYRCDRTSATTISNFVGDSGSGGTAGLVPAPAAGDGAAGDVLQANGTWGPATTVTIPTGTLQTGTQGYLGNRYVQLGVPQANQWYDAFGPFAQTGTNTASVGSTQTAGNFYNQLRRLTYSSNTTVNSQAGQHYALLKVWRGNAAGLGGFIYSSRFGAGSWHSDGRWAMGVWGTTGLPGTTTEPSALTNVFLIGQDSTDTNIQVMSNDASGTATKTSLGGSFPRPTASVSVFDITLSCQPNASTMQYAITNLHTGATASGSVSTNLPDSATFMFPFRYSNNGPTTTGSVEFSLAQFYVETPY